MTEFSKALSPGWRGLHPVRPRFVYLWMRVRAIPLPIVLFAPLVLLELFLAILLRALDHPKGRPLRAAASQGQIWQLRKLPPFTLLELKVQPKASQAKALQVYIRVGLW